MLTTIEVKSIILLSDGSSEYVRTLGVTYIICLDLQESHIKQQNFCLRAQCVQEVVTQFI